jgi:hypothetical protein
VPEYATRAPLPALRHAVDLNVEGNNRLKATDIMSALVRQCSNCFGFATRGQAVQAHI